MSLCLWACTNLTPLVSDYLREYGLAVFHTWILRYTILTYSAQIFQLSLRDSWQFDTASLVLL